MLFFFILFLIAPTLAYAQEGEKGEIEHSSLAGIISSWIGGLALGTSLGIGLQVKDFSTILSTQTLRKIVFVLSITAGAIHLLMIPDHMAEAFEWGVFFTVVGIAQIFYGFVFVKINKSFIYYLGAIGNAAIVALYVYARVFTPPFAPTAGPVTEIDGAGICADVIEVALVILLLYSLRFQKLAVKIRSYNKLDS